MIATVTSRTTLQNAVPERTFQRLTGRIINEAGVGFKPDTVTLTLYDATTGTVINGRDHVDVLASVATDGTLTLDVNPADVVVVDSTVPTERHIALLEWTWGSEKAGKHEIEMYVTNLSKVP